MKFYIGIDNGTTGSVTVIDSEGKLIRHALMPSRRELSYTKTVNWISRVDVKGFARLLDTTDHASSFALLERPMINPMRFKSSIVAARALEATLLILEELGIPYQYIDSKEWQKALLPAGVAKEQLKLAADCLAVRLYKVTLAGRGAGDSVLIAHHARLKQL